MIVYDILGVWTIKIVSELLKQAVISILRGVPGVWTIKIGNYEHAGGCGP